MKKPPIPDNEVERLKELKSLKLDENLNDLDLDLITKLASDICKTKISLVTIVDAKSQIFKSKYGLEIERTSRDVAFCAHAIIDPNKMLIVNDATEDERFKENPLVLKEPKIAFYAGMPLSTKEGIALGTLCVIDSKPKVLSASQIEALKSLAKLVERLLESRKKSFELEEIQTQLQLQKSQTEEITFTIAHDLKNPLDSIQGFLELLQQDPDTSLGNEALQYIDYAKQSTQKMTGLIYEILAFAKLSAMDKKSQTVDIGPIIKSIVDLNLPIVKSENIKIEYPDSAVLKTSKMLVSIVLRNLVGNAIKYRSEERPLEIIVKVQDHLKEWVISVSDNGKGIQEQNMEKVFRPFYRENKNSDTGVGMGLAICKKIIQNLGGRLDVESSYGKGSTFSFTILK
jgi:signal transduction histidine kinase